MNREIKFRTWIPDYEEMIVLDNTGVQKFDCENGFLLMFTADNYKEIWAHENYGIVRDAVVMQYTGLKDKNGLEIYEGDIVMLDHWKSPDLFDYSNPFTVEYYEGEINFKQGLYNNFKGSLTGKLIIEVIGNIYENPELLQNK